MVSELEKGRKDLERKVANLFMDNVSLVKKLKASRALEAEQMKGIGNLEEQLVQALKTQVNMHFYTYSHLHINTLFQCWFVIYSCLCTEC